MKKTAQSLIEYGLILALVAIIALAVLTKMGKSVSDAGNNSGNTIQNASNESGNAFCDQTGGTWDPATNLCKP